MPTTQKADITNLPTAQVIPLRRFDTSEQTIQRRLREIAIELYYSDEAKPEPAGAGPAQVIALLREGEPS